MIATSPEIPGDVVLSGVVGDRGRARPNEPGRLPASFSAFAPSGASRGSDREVRTMPSLGVSSPDCRGFGPGLFLFRRHRRLSSKTFTASPMCSQVSLLGSSKSSPSVAAAMVSRTMKAFDIASILEGSIIHVSGND